MPTKRRQVRKRKKGMFTRGQIRELMTGHADLFDGFTGPTQSLYRGGPGWYEAGACWDILESQLMRDWLAQTDPEYGGPGTRPFFWWLDGNHRRERTDGGVHPHDCPNRNARIAELESQYPHMKGVRTRLYWGLPSAWMPGFDERTAQYETQTEYIARKNLWLPGERELWESQQ